MTVVVAARTKTDAWMAYDCASSTDDTVIYTSTPKAMKNAGGGIMGSAGNWAVINMLHDLRTSECSPEDISNALRALKEKNPEAVAQMELLMVYPGKPLVLIDSDGATVELRSNFFAIGAGAAYAIGYLEGCATVGGEELVKAAKIAAKHCVSVSEPVTLLHCIKTPKTQTKEVTKGPVNET